MTVVGGTITLDGLFTDWIAANLVSNPANSVAGYSVYGQLVTDATAGVNYVIGIQATNAASPAIGAGTRIYLNTDQQTATGASLSWANVGYEYYVQFDLDTAGQAQPYLYTSAGVQVSTTPLSYGVSGGSLEVAIPQALLTPAGGTAPKSINFIANINNSGTGWLPGDVAGNPQYTITDPSDIPVAGTITLDGLFTDWTAANVVSTPANSVAGYSVYGQLVTDATAGVNYVIGIQATGAASPAIGAGTTIYLNTDQETATGASLSWANVGYEYYVQFATGATGTVQPYLYTAAGVQVSTTPLSCGVSGGSLEIAIPQALLTPAGGAAPKSINFIANINNSGTGWLPGDVAGNPQYTITDPSTPLAVPVAGNITLDGLFTDWTAANVVSTPANSVAGYSVYGQLVTDATAGVNYVIGIQATGAASPAIGAGTTIYLNTDQQTATGASFSWANVGYEYYVQFAADAAGKAQPYLYNSAGVQVSSKPLSCGLSGGSLEIAIPQALLTPAGGTAPKSINFIANINNSGTGWLPGNVAGNPQYAITDPSTIVAVSHDVKKVAIVWSDETAANYFKGSTDASGTPINPDALKTAYNDLFMAAQNQVEAAGVSYDIITAANMATMTAAQLAQYSALVIPSMTNVKDATQAAQIQNVLAQVENNYHVPIITSGDFMTADANNAPLTSPYAAMQAVLGVAYSSGGSGTYSVSVAPGATSNPIMAGYNATDLIGGASGQFAGDTAGYYTNTGYSTYTGYNGAPTTVLANINVTTAPGAATASSVAGVIQTTTGATNTHFASANLLADGNLLQHVVQNAVFGTAPSLALDKTRFAGLVASRTDMDQTQFPADIAAGTGKGVYDALIPILQQWKTQFNFVGSYYMVVGDTSASDNANSLAAMKPYADQMLAMGNEIGSHSLNHLLVAPSVDANGNPVPINANGYSSWEENTNTLYLTPPANGSAPNWTFDYEFGQSNTLINQAFGITIAGAAVPGAAETSATTLKILPYYQSANGVTGYLTGGWTGAGAGYPNAFGFIDPSNTNSVYIAPNMTFDFTEVQYNKKTPAVALADWKNLFNQLSANSATPVIVWPWHDYGPTDWNTDTDTPNAGIYTTAMFTDFIAYAYNAGYEFVTQEDLASRIAAQQRATITETNPAANTINVTVAPGSLGGVQDDLGTMALNVVNGGANVIQNAGTGATGWYAYDSKSLFLAKNGLSNVTVTLGTAQDDLTHIASLPMRADLQTVTGDGQNLSYSVTGDGSMLIDLKTPGANIVSISQTVARAGAATAIPAGNWTATLTGAALDQLTLTFKDPALTVGSSSPVGIPLTHNVTITEGAAAVGIGNGFIFGGSADDVIPVALNDYVNGGAGVNMAVLTGLASNFAYTWNADGSVTVKDSRAATTAGYLGTDTLLNIQNFKFSDGSVLTAAQLKADITPPTITKATASPQGAVTSGTVAITLTASEAVNVAAGTQLLLSNGGIATFASGSGTAAPVFNYVVPANQSTGPTASLSVTGILEPSATAITDLAGNAASSLLGAAANLGVQINKTQTATGSPALNITGNSVAELFGATGRNVKFDAAATAAGTLVLDVPSRYTGKIYGLSPNDILDLANLAFDAATTKASYAGTSAAGTLTVTSGAQTANISLVGNYVGAAITLGSDGRGGTKATLGAPIDTTPPTITKATASPKGAVTSGTVAITLTASEAVNVAAGTQLLLSNGGVATYASGSGTAAPVFNYVVPTNQSTGPTASLSVTGVQKPSATAITDLAGNAASSLLGAANSLGVQINPTKTATGSPALNITGNSVAELFGATGRNVKFDAAATAAGTLVLDAATRYTGKVYGLAANDILDLANFAFGSTTKASYAGTSTAGVLTVTNGSQTAKISLVGNYTGAAFTPGSDGHGGTALHI